MDRPNRPPPSSVRVRVTDRMDCPRLTRSPASSGSFLPSSLSHFSSSSVFSDDDDGRTFLAEWKMERPATTTEWSVSFILSAFSVFAARAPSQPLDYPSFLSASFHRQSDMEGGEKKSHPPPHCSPRQCLRRRCRSTLSVIITTATTKEEGSPLSSRLIDSVASFCSL